MVKFLGISDESTTCECCGKRNLKRTVALDMGEVGVVRYGVDCAARALGMRSDAVKAAGTAVSYAQNWLAQDRTRESIANVINVKWCPAYVIDGKLYIGSTKNPYAVL
jgi:hypothetical protein